ncbi:hypothetical protein M422DRAFT_263297 [Sphaerobolus stellatus SS14]|uniref:Zn(2)-C6 fungal-type domain-containing protein n=1 Tax=Sphaerobolus stellatus (strain SS14) TaxID=990650 RepID=A0A0C9TW04_SPHS4|nr:hypothetical protein M422DRAFT_263297 [Sphaerobolus stellatus SS14]
MSAAASSSKNTTSSAILYKKAKDVLRLPTVEKSDSRRMLSGFKVVAGFNTRRDLRRNKEWDGYSEMEWEALVNGYWQVYDKEFKELEELYVGLVRKEAVEKESQRKSDEKKKKNKPAVPVVLGPETDDSESEPNLAFLETCIGCERAKVHCNFTHPVNGKKVACDRCVHHKTNCTYRNLNDYILQQKLKKIGSTLVNLDIEAGNRNRLEAEGLYYKYHQQMLDGLHWSMEQLMKCDKLDLRLQTLEHCYQDDTSVPDDLQDGIFRSHDQVIDRYNKVATVCGAQMRRISLRYKLGKAFVTQVMLLDRYGDVVFEEDVEPGPSKRAREEDDAEPGPSKRVRVEEHLESGEKGMEELVEKEVGPDPTPVIDKGKGKEKEMVPEENGDETMKE